MNRVLKHLKDGWRGLLIGVVIFLGFVLISNWGIFQLSLSLTLSIMALCLLLGITIDQITIAKRIAIRTAIFRAALIIIAYLLLMKWFWYEAKEVIFP